VWPGPARAAARRTTRLRPARPGPLRDRRLPSARAERGDQVGPSPVNRGHPGSKHHLIVSSSPRHPTRRHPDRRAPTRRHPTAGAARRDPTDPRAARPPAAQATQAVRRRRLRLRQVPPPAAPARHHPTHRPPRSRPGLRAWQSPLSRRTRLRLATRLQSPTHPLRATRRYPPQPAPTRLRPHLPPETGSVILKPALRAPRYQTDKVTCTT
jgi:hypothetical protein